MEALAEYKYETDDYELEARHDLQTLFSEMIDGNMRTEFDLLFDGFDLYGPDGRGLDEVTKNGLEHAQKLIRTNPNMWFEVRRRSIERNQERPELVRMANGEGPNTMIVVSDFPSELRGAKEDTGGYNITRKQAMLRVFIRNPDGVIRMYSQTLDGSNREALEAIYGLFGEIPGDGELLGQHIRVDVDYEQQASFVDRLVSAYDQSLSEQFGNDEWYAGRRPADIRNTYKFVCRQTDLIETFVKLKLAGQLEDKLMYNAIATMQKRFEDEKKGIINLNPKEQIPNRTRLMYELELIGNMARQEGRSFSACGVTMTAEGFDSEVGLGSVGYGHKSEKDCTYISKMCPICKTKNVKTHETEDYIEGSCHCKIKKTKPIAVLVPILALAA